MEFDFSLLMESEVARQLISDVLDGLTTDPVTRDSIMESTREILGGKTFGQGLGLTSEHLTLILGLAAQQYLAAHYEEALRLYAFAATMNQFDAQAMKGMAMCHQRLGFHQEALRCFGLSLLLEPADVECVMLTAESLGHLGHDREALDIAEKIIAMDGTASQSDQVSLMRARAEGLKELLSRRMSPAG